LGDLFFCLRVKMLVLTLQFSRGVWDQFSPKSSRRVGGPGSARGHCRRWRQQVRAHFPGEPRTRRRPVEQTGAGEVRTPSKRNSDARSFGVRWCLSPFPKGSLGKSAGVELIRTSN